MIVARGHILQLAGDAVRVVSTSVVVRGRQNPGHMKLPQRLRKARKSAGMNPTALSRAAGVGPSTASMIEAEVRLPRLPIVERLADALHVSAGWLGFGSDLPWVPPQGDEMRCGGLAERALAQRSLLGLSLREVDRRAAVAEGTIRSIERGTMPTIDTLEQIAGALNVSPAWLAFGIGRVEPSLRRHSLRSGAHAGSTP